MNRGPIYRSPLLHVALLVGVGALVLAPAVRGCSAPSTLSVTAIEQGRTPLQRRTGPPPHPPQDPAPGAIRLTGNERLEWEQDGKTLEDVQRWHYVVMVGLARRDMKDVKCEPSKGPKGPFVCSGILPSLEQGNHQLRVIAIDVKNGRELASPWSRPILVFRQ